MDGFNANESDKFRHIHSLELNYHVQKLNDLYTALFSNEFTNEFNMNNIINQKSILLLTIATKNGNNSQELFNYINRHIYHHKNKLDYCYLHNYTYIIDTLNYIEYFNISRYNNKTFDLSKLSTNITDLFKSNKYKHYDPKIIEYSYDVNRETPEYNAENKNQNIYKKPSKNLNYHKFGNKTKIFFSNIYTTDVWNKCLSLLFWSQYYDYILLLDDDAFISNILYNIETILNISESFFVYQVGHISEAFALLFNTTNKTYSYNYFIKWFNTRQYPNSFAEQNGFWHVNLINMMNDIEFQYFIKSETSLQIYNEYQELYQCCMEFPSMVCIKRINNRLLKRFWLKYKKPAGNISWDFHNKTIPFSKNLNWGKKNNKINELFFNNNFIIHLKNTKYSYIFDFHKKYVNNLTNKFA